MSRKFILFALAALAVAAPAFADPTAVQPVDANRLMGRWYEILRTPNKMQSNCFAAYQEWTRKGDEYTIGQVCHRDGPSGREAKVDVIAKSLNPDNTMFEAGFFGGLIHAKYQITDHAPDYSWMIATTSGGHFPKLLARTPSLPAAEQDMLKQRMAKLGFDVSKLEPSGG